MWCGRAVALRFHRGFCLSGRGGSVTFSVSIALYGGFLYGFHPKFGCLWCWRSEAVSGEGAGAEML